MLVKVFALIVVLFILLIIIGASFMGSLTTPSRVVTIGDLFARKLYFLPFT
ncbi:YjcZ family sporulation protein [Neobacillus vireti]|uniref:YjcZ family sporulation protein n=1 Tax=Neobacillus vireti TaxID=220686 RepID=UPI001F35F0D3|nr:YjcZ family sporulation protein [Neobacillus vireti]